MNIDRFASRRIWQGAIGGVMLIGLCIAAAIVGLRERSIRDAAESERLALIAEYEQRELEQATLERLVAEVNAEERAKPPIRWNEIAHWKYSTNTEPVDRKFSVIGGKWRIRWRCESMANFSARITDEFGDVFGYVDNTSGKGMGELVYHQDGKFAVEVKCDRGRWEVFIDEQVPAD